MVELFFNLAKHIMDGFKNLIESQRGKNKPQEIHGKAHHYYISKNYKETP